MSLIVSIDPGQHVGFAVWREGTDSPDGQPRCVWATEFTPPQAEDWLWSRLIARPRGLVGEAIRAVYMEEFRLRGGRAALQQQGSDFPASQLIGAVRLMTRMHSHPVEFGLITPGVRAAALERATALGIVWPSHGHGGHAKDAVAVGIAALGLRAADLRQPHWHTKPQPTRDPLE